MHFMRDQIALEKTFSTKWLAYDSIEFSLPHRTLDAIDTLFRLTYINVI